MKRLPWKYCECGCHGHQLDILGESFWVGTYFKDPNNGDYTIERINLHSGHSWTAPLIGTYKSWEEIDAEVLKRLKEKAEKIKEELKLIEEVEAWEESKCTRCGGEGTEPHTCPYAEEIHYDYDTLCTCCEDCTHECLMDI